MCDGNVHEWHPRYHDLRLESDEAKFLVEANKLYRVFRKYLTLNTLRDSLHKNK
jgi:hypothetical protein